MWIIEMSKDGHNEYFGPYDFTFEGGRDRNRLTIRRDQLGKGDVSITLRRVDELENLDAALGRF